jgi:protein TonB
MSPATAFAHFQLHRSPRSEATASRLGVLALIVLLHGGLLFFSVQSTLDRVNPQPPVPREIFARFIAAEPARPAPAIQPIPHTPAKPVEAPLKPAKPPVAIRRQSQAPTPAEPKPPSSNTTPTSNAKPATPSTSNDASTAASAPAAAVPTPSGPAAPAAPRTVTGVAYIRPPAPDYPALSRRMKEEGTVRLRILVNESGRAQNVEVQKSSGSGRLDNAARDAALQALFKPHLEDGRPVSVYVSVPINFSLQ